MPEYHTVYVIDDDEPVRDSVALLLEARALAVQGFASGPEFLEAAASLAPGCIVTDMRMPMMDGIELLRRLRERNLHLPVIVMTAHGEVSLAVQALKAGAADFIEKPFSGEVLIDAVLSAFRRSIERTRGMPTSRRSRAVSRRSRHASARSWTSWLPATRTKSSHTISG